MEGAIEETELVIPSTGKTIIKRPISTLKSPRRGKNPMFDAASIEAEANSFDIVSPGGEEGEAMLATRCPSLLAIRNKVKSQQRPITTLKSPRGKTREAEIITPRSATSILRNRPATPMRDSRMNFTEKITRDIENEKMSLEFEDDPIAYFSKRKDGRGHRFIYLNYAGDKSDPFFNPYELVKTAYADVNSEYFTMSANGVTHLYPNGTTEHIPIDRWAKESSIYAAIRKLKMFSQYFCWKPFRIWKKFVYRQRYNQISRQLLTHQYFHQHSFFQTAIEIQIEYIDSKHNRRAEDLLDQMLLSFHPQKRYELAKFQEIERTNIDSLTAIYTEYIERVVRLVLDLDATIRDPAVLQVKDSDFPEIKRRNPNLGQLMLLERKKADRRVALTEQVNQQIMQLGYFIRSIDNLMLESLALAARKAWLTAGDNVCSHMSSIFNVEVSYNPDGTIKLSPTLEELTEAIQHAFNFARGAIKSLPRLLSQTQLRPHVRESHPHYKRLIKQGPHVEDIMKRYTEMEETEKKIIEVVTQSYQESEIASRVFSDFFDIYQLGKTWKVTDYISTRSGKPNVPLLVDHTDKSEPAGMDFDTEPIVNIEQIRQDLEKFDEDEKKLSQFIPCTVRGAIYIDSKTLRNDLSPIPIRTQQKIREMLNDLLSGKMDRIKITLSNTSAALKKKPESLQAYVEYVRLIGTTDELIQNMQNEEKYIDRLIILVEELNKLGSANDQIQNQIPQMIASFIQAQKEAIETKNQANMMFVEQLRAQTSRLDAKIRKYKDIASSMPRTIAEVRCEQMREEMSILKEKIDNLRPAIDELIQYQEILEVQFSAFVNLKSTSDYIDAAKKLYETIQSWKNVERSCIVTNFETINADTFQEDITNIAMDVNDLVTSIPSIPGILTELQNNVELFQPYLESIVLLNTSSMQVRHWQQLYQMTNMEVQYHPDLTLKEMTVIGLLKHTDAIKQVTNIALSERNLQDEFSNIESKWTGVTLPIVDGIPKSDDTLLLTDVKPMIADLESTVISLKRMCSLQFVHGVTENISKMSHQLQNAALILESWYRFQENWLLVTSLFNHEESKSVLQPQASKLQWVRRRWTSIVKHAYKDLGLLTVCQFPSLLDITNENNSTLEQIISSLGAYVDSKRIAMPRLFALSNSDIIALITSRSFATLSRFIPRLFMNMIDIDSSEESQQNNALGVLRLKLTGLIGSTNDAIPFSKPVTVAGPIDHWLKLMTDSLKNSMKELVSSMLAKSTATLITDWILTVPTHVAMTVLEIEFCAEVDECFNSFENNIRSFVNYETSLKNKYASMVSLMDTPLSTTEVLKASAIITQLTNQIDLLKQFSDPTTNRWWWKQMPKILYNNAKEELGVTYGETTESFGYEMWGDVPNFVYTPSVQKMVISALESNAANIIGSPETGRRSMIMALAAKFGRFIYSIPAMPDMSISFATRIFISAASSGSWAIINDAEHLPYNTLAHISDCYFEMHQARINESSKITINDMSTNFSKRAKIFITTSTNNCEMPEQLKSILKPVALSTPEKRVIIEVKLASYGVRSARQISQKICTVVSSIVDTFSSRLLSTSSLHHINQVMEFARDLIRESKEPSFRGTFDSTFVCEQFCVARAIYLHFVSELPDSYEESLINMIYAGFNIYNKLDYFATRVKQPGIFSIDSMIDALASALNTVTSELPDQDYIVQQAICLFTQMLTHRVIIIHGPPKSGKTTVLSMLSSAIDLVNQNAQLKSKFKLLCPIATSTIYFSSESSNLIVGSLTSEKDWANGKLDVMVDGLMSISEHQRRVLVLDGIFDKKFEILIKQIASQDYSILPSFNSVYFGQNGGFNIIIETDTISNMAPSTLPQCGLLYMKNLQQTESCEIVNPDAIITEYFPGSMAAQISKAFKDVLPPIVKYIYHTPNILCYSEAFKKVPSGSTILSDHLPRMTLAMFNVFLKKGDVKMIEDSDIKQGLVIAAYRVFSPIIEKSQLTQFDLWLRTQFRVSIIPQWHNEDINQRFVDAYPTASLQTHRVSGNQIEIVDCTRLDEEIYFVDGNREYPQSVLVPTPEMMTAGFALESAIETKKPILIVGESGKTVFNRLFFRNKQKYCVVRIPADASMTSETAYHFINQHSEIARKFSDESKKTVLIFDNISPVNYELMEYIRMIIETKSIIRTSKHDLKGYDHILMKKFTMIVTTSDYSSLPPRFLAKFIPIRLDPISPMSATYVIGRIMRFFQVDEEFTNKTTSFIASAISQVTNFPRDMKTLIKFVEGVCLMKEKQLKQQNDEEYCIRSILNDINLFFIQKHPDSLPTLETVFRQYFRAEEAIKQLEEMNSVFVTVYDTQRNGKPLMMASNDTMDNIREELSIYMQVYNNSATEKIDMKLYIPVVKRWRLMRRTLSMPGGSLILKGGQGSGRFTLTRFLAHTFQEDFIHITPDIYTQTDHSYLMAIFRDISTNSALLNKKCIMFMRHSGKTITPNLQLAIDFYKHHNFAMFFDDAACADFCMKFGGRAIVNTDQMSQAYDAVNATIARNFHLVIAADRDACEIPDFDVPIVDFDEYTEEELIDAAAFNVSKEQNSNVFGSYVRTLPKILTRLHTAATKLCGYSHTNLFFDFVDLFCYYSYHDYVKLVENSANLLAAINFFGDLHESAYNVEKKFEEVSPNLQRIMADCDNLQATFDSKRASMASRKKELDDMDAALSKQLRAIQSEVDHLTISKQMLEPRIKKCNDLVATLTDNDIETLRINAVDPMPSLKLLMEVLCIFLEIPISFDRHGQALLNDKKFISIIVSRINHETVSPVVVAAAKPYFEREDFTYEVMNEVSPAMKVIYEWLDSIVKYSLNEQQLTKALVKLAEVKEEARNVLADNDRERREMEEVEEKLQEEDVAIRSSIRNKEAAEQQYNSIKSIRQRIDDMNADMDDYVEKWSHKSTNINAQREKIIGNALMFSYYIVYCGILPLEERKKLVTLVSSEIRSGGFTADYDHAFEHIQDRLLRDSSSDDTVFNPAQGVIFDAAYEVYLTNNVLRVPLIIDPDGLALNYYVKVFKSKGAIFVSVHSMVLDQVIIQALKEGSLLVITDIDDLHPYISSLLTMARLGDIKETKNIRIGTRVVPVNENFKLVLITNHRKAKNIPMQLLSRVSLVDYSSSSLEACRTMILNSILAGYMPDMLPRFNQLQRMTMEGRVDLHMRETDIIETVATAINNKKENPAYDYLDDESFYQDLMRSKNQLFESRTRIVMLEKTQDDVMAAVNTFKDIADRLLIVWAALSRFLPRISKSNVFTFTAFEKILNQSMMLPGFPPGELRLEQARNLTKFLTNQVIEKVLPIISQRDGLILMFIISFLEKVIDGKAVINDLDIIIEHLSDEKNSSVDFNTVDLNMGDPFDHLKFTNIVNVFQFFSRVVAEKFGNDFISMHPYFEVDSLMSPSASVPSLVISKKLNPADLVQLYVQHRTRADTFSVYSLYENADYLKEVGTHITNAMNKGLRVMLNITTKSNLISAFVADVVDTMRTTSIHTNFRLIINATENVELPLFIHNNSVRLFYDDFPNARNTMLKTFGQVNTAIKAPINGANAKRVAYAISLAHAIVSFSSLMDPIGVTEQIDIPIEYVRSAVELLCDYTEEIKRDAPVKNIRDFMQDVLLGGSVIDVFDRRKIRSLMYAIFQIDFTKDDFLFCGSIIDGERWKMPPEGSISHFTNYIMRLPPLPVPGILMMNTGAGVPVRNWMLSRWLISGLDPLRNREPRRFEDSIATRVESYAMSLPDRIGTGSSSKFKTPLQLVMRGEIDSLNKVLNTIRMELSMRTPRAIQLADGKVPHEWAEAVGFVASESSQRFISFICEKREFLIRWLKDLRLDVIPAYLLTNIRGLFQALLNDISLKRASSSDAMALEISFLKKDEQPVKDSIVISGLNVVSGRYDATENKLISDRTGLLASPLPNAMITVVKAKQRTPNTYMCPLIRFLRIRGINGVGSYTDGQPENLIWYFPLECEQAPATVVANSTCITCVLPEQVNV